MRLDQGRLAGGLDSVRVEAGDVIQLEVALGQGDAHYDITNVELTISRRDGSAEWDLARDARADFLAGNPHADSPGIRASGNSTTWRGATASAGCRRSTAVLAGLGRGRCRPARGTGRPSKKAARDLAGAVAAAGPDDALVRELTERPEPLLGQRPRRRPLPRPGGPGRAREALRRAATPRGRRSRPCPTPWGSRTGDRGMARIPESRTRGSTSGGVTRSPAAASRGTSRRSLAGRQPPRIGEGSGRLELARWIAAARQPDDGPRDGQPDLAAPLRRGDRPHAQQLRPQAASRPAIPSCSTGWPAGSWNRAGRSRPCTA